MSTIRFSGVYTALATPFHGDGVDFESLSSLVERQLAGGVSGLVPVGTTGESPTVSYEEHIAIIRATVEAAAGRVPVVAGAGSNSTAEAMDLMKKSETAGADAFLLVAPYYNKPNQEGLFRHFSTLAATTEKPIILYSIPSRCGIEISVETAQRLYEQHPNVCAMKAAEGSCEKVVDYVNTLGPEYDVLSGDDALTLPFMSVGACGVISVASNILPAEVSAMVNQFAAGKSAEAQSAFLRLFPLFKALFAEPNPVPVKYALKRLGQIRSEAVRLPLVEASEETRALINQLLDEIVPSPA